MIGYTIGTYKILEKIGEGGMGAVYRGMDVMLERDVAIKALRPELGRQPDLVERFRSEAKTLAKLNHPNIATVFNFLRQGDDFFMVMEFVRGETLDNAIRRFGAMPVDRAVSLFCQALEGIEHAHRLGIIHRDIKPANMMLTEDGALKVMDFGIARVLGTARMTKQGNIVGTIEYMSPEQVRGLDTDSRSDIYSMGILLYEMVTGRVPFSSESEYDLMKMQIEDAPSPPRSFAGHIPQPVEAAIMRALAKRPEARFQTARELKAALIGYAATGSAPVASTPSYVVPAFDNSPPAARPSEAVKETRLGNGSLGMPAGPGAQYQTPRIPVPPQPQIYAGYAGQPQFAQPAVSSNSGLKILAAVGAGIIVLIVTPVALFFGLRGKPASSTAPVPTNQRAAPNPEPVRSAPAPSAGDPARSPSQPLTTPETGRPMGVGALPVAPLPGAGDTSNSNKPVKTVTRAKDDAAAKAKTDAEARAKAEREKKKAEARRLLDQ